MPVGRQYPASAAGFYGAKFFQAAAQLYLNGSAPGDVAERDVFAIGESLGFRRGPWDLKRHANDTPNLCPIPSRKVLPVARLQRAASCRLLMDSPFQATQEGELIARQTDTLRRGTVSRRDMTNNPSPPINLLDRVGGPNISADNAARWFLLNGNIHMTLEAALADPVTSAAPINRVIVGRLIMPLNKVEEMATGLLEFIQQMKAQDSTLPGRQALLEISQDASI